MKPVFVHISKNAGTSIIAAAGDAITVAGHQPASRWVRQHGRTAPLFAIVRNPYDRVVSEYCFRRRRFEGGDADPHLVAMHAPFDVWVRATFEDGDYRSRVFFERTLVPYNRANMVDDDLLWFVPQTRWLGDGAGSLLVDHLLRFENLDAEWAAFCELHDLDVRPLGRLNASPAPPEVIGRLDEPTRAIIAHYYRDDFDTFGYER